MNYIILSEKSLDDFTEEFLRKNYDNWGSKIDMEIRGAINHFSKILTKRFTKKIGKKKEIGNWLNDKSQTYKKYFKLND